MRQIILINYAGITRSKYAFCCPKGGGGYPIPGPDGGYPHPALDGGGGGYPHPSTEGYPSLDRGVPPSSLEWGVPPSLNGGFPHSRWDGGIPSVQGWMGYSPCPRLDEVPSTPSKAGWGYPLSNTWWGYPLFKARWGTPPSRGYPNPPPGRVYPPPPCGQTDGWTDTCQNITFTPYYVRRR